MKSFSRVITRIRHEFLSFPSKIWSDRVDVVVVATRFKALLLGAARGHGTSSSRKTLTSRRRSLSLSLFEHFRKVRDRLKRGERVLHCDTLSDGFFPRAS